MKEEIIITNIEELNKIIIKLVESKQVTINIPNLTTQDVISILQKSNHLFERTGFKSYLLSPVRANYSKEYVYYRLVFFIISISVIITLLVFGISKIGLLWNKIEIVATKIPFLSGILANILAALIIVLITFLFRKKIAQMFSFSIKKYLGIHS